jgi:hypothetical protein
MEIEHDQLPISVTLVKPAAIGTPFPEHAKNRLEGAVQPTLPSPIYKPEEVAKTILDCAEHARRDVFVGGQAQFMSLMSKLAPRLTDFYMERFMFKRQQRPADSAPQQESLTSAPEHEGQERGHFVSALHSSPYSAVIRNSKTTATLAVAAGAAIGTGLYFLSKNKRSVARSGARWLAKRSSQAVHEVGHRVGIS